MPAKQGEQVRREKISQPRTTRQYSIFRRFLELITENHSILTENIANIVRLLRNFLEETLDQQARTVWT